MPQPATSDHRHAHVPHCQCEQCLNPEQSKSYIAETISALCDDCRPHTVPIVVLHSRGLRLRCDECDVVLVQGSGIEALQ